MSTWHDTTHTGTAIFLNKENLLFSLPLISVCTVYAYFKFIPLHIGLSIIGAGIVIYKINNAISKRAIEKTEEKIANLDEGFLHELAADELHKEKVEKQKAARKKMKAESKLRQRIAAEKKMKNKSNGQEDGDEDDEDEDEDVSTFVRNSRGNKTKRN